MRRRAAEGARRAVEPQLSFTLRAGEQLKVGRVTGTAYLAVAGGFAHTRTLGSFSTYARAALGGVEGRAPQRGDSIACDAASRSELVVPLLLDDALIGVFDLDSPVPGRFDVEDQVGLETIAALFVRSLRTNS